MGIKDVTHGHEINNVKNLGKYIHTFVKKNVQDKAHYLTS